MLNLCFVYECFQTGIFLAHGAFFDGEWEALKFLWWIKIKNCAKESAREKNILLEWFFKSLVADWITLMKNIKGSLLPETDSLQVSKSFDIKKICKKNF
jgi:hypothetical protein